MIGRNMLSVISVMSLCLASLAAATESTGPPEVELSSTLHFIAPDGSDLPVMAGIYGVEPGDKDRLRLLAPDGRLTIEIQAAPARVELTCSNR